MTSGLPGKNTGIFDSGPMTFGDKFQLSFYTENNLVGEFPYYDTVNPEITGKISSNNMVVQGQSFEFRSGTCTTLDLAKNNATLLSFTPIGMSVDQDDIMCIQFLDNKR